MPEGSSKHDDQFYIMTYTDENGETHYTGVHSSPNHGLAVQHCRRLVGSGNSFVDLKAGTLEELQKLEADTRRQKSLDKPLPSEA